MLTKRVYAYVVGYKASVPGLAWKLNETRSKSRQWRLPFGPTETRTLLHEFILVDYQGKMHYQK